MAKLFSLIITLLFLVVGLTLGVLNPGFVAFDLFLTQVELPLSILLAIAMVLGMVLAAAYFVPQVLKLKWQLKHQEKQNHKQANEMIVLKKEVVDLKTKTVSNDEMLKLPKA